MKISLIVTLSFLSCYPLLGRILNGYEPLLESSRNSLHKLNELLMEEHDMPISKRHSIKAKIEKLIDLISCYQLTEELISQLKSISPEIYREIDTLKDKRGRPTDVYVKLIRKENAKIHLRAASFFDQKPQDEDMNVSEYGNFSVSIEIWIVDNALFLLSHELGHVSYVVPNLANYTKFYKSHYRMPNVDLENIGHVSRDQSGKHALGFEKRFLTDKAAYLKSGGEKPGSVLTRMNKIKKDNRQIESAGVQTVVVSGKGYPPGKILSEDILTPLERK